MAENSENPTAQDFLEQLKSANTSDSDGAGRTVNDGDTADTVNDDDTTDTVNDGHTTDTVNDGDITDTVNDGDTTDTVNDGDTTDTMNDGGTTDTMNDAGTSDAVIDEPLFEKKELVKPAKKSLFIPLVVFLFMIVLLIAIVFNLSDGDGDGDGNSQYKVTEPTLQKDVYLDDTDPYSSIPNSVSLNSVYEDAPHDKQEQNTKLEKKQSLPEIENVFNTLLVTKLDEVLAIQNSLTEKLVNLSASTENLSAQIQSNQSFLKSEMKTLKNITQSLGLDGRNRDAAISELLSVVKGFEVDIQNQRSTFPLELLHSEVWSGKHRVVGFKASSPRNILKIYVGEQYEGWQLISIEDQIVKFKNLELNEIVEIML